MELFQTENFTQSFYETTCDQSTKDRPCQFIEHDLAPYSRCVQQWSYVYAMGRTFGRFFEQFRFDYIRVAAGCKCQLPAHVVSSLRPDEEEDEDRAPAASTDQVQLDVDRLDDEVVASAADNDLTE
jgi:hypothetical protein